MSDAVRTPALAGVLETCLYHDARETAAMEGFYTEVLGLPLVSRWPGGIALRAGAGVLLLFERQGLAARDSPLSAHGTDGPGHACLVVGEARDYERSKQLLDGAGIEIAHEESWDGGLRSFYFTDPAGNLLEIAAGDIWPG